MKYPAQSDLWKIERILEARKTNGLTSKGRVLGRFRQVFPIRLFTDELIVQEHRVVWVINKGPWVKELITTMATDIASIDSSTGPFFGHLHIKSLTGGPEILIDSLFRNDVYRARYIIEGIIIAARQGEEFQNENLETERMYLFNRGKIN